MTKLLESAQIGDFCGNISIIFSIRGSVVCVTNQRLVPEPKSINAHLFLKRGIVRFFVFLTESKRERERERGRERERERKRGSSHRERESRKGSSA